MNLLLISPLLFSINENTRYAGIERLVAEYAQELVKEHKVTVMGHADSVYADGVSLLPTRPVGDIYLQSEVLQYQTYQSYLRKFDVIHDFSHQHLAARYNNLPTLNIFWHAPSIAQYPKAPYNIIALSQWAKREFRRVYQQEARYQYSIGINTDKYKLSKRHRNDRFLAVARTGAEKGNLEAALLCHKLGFPLDINSARGPELMGQPHTEYERQVLSLVDGKQIRIWENSMPEPEKIKMMQTNKALLYITTSPEVTSHKIQECILCGLPVIVPKLGALPEIVTHGVNGFLCETQEEYIKAVLSVNKLKPLTIYRESIERFSLVNTVKNYIPLYQDVARGLRW